MGRLDGKVAVITGAASGMGRGTAIRFAGEGAAVVIADLNVEGGEAAVRDCKENGGRAVFQKTDVSAEADVKAAVARAVKEFGRLDIMYNNAGLGGAVGPIERDHGRELGQEPGDFAALGFPWNEVRDSRDAQGWRRIDNLDRVGRWSSRRRGTARL